MQNGMNAVEMLALSKCVKSKDAKEARTNVNPGSYEVNCLVRVAGTMNVGEDYTQNKTASMPQMKMLLAALKLNGVCVRSFVRQYLDGAYEPTKDDEKELNGIWDELAGNFSSSFKGKVTSKLEVTPVEEAAE
jgi:hypothetical protein